MKLWCAKDPKGRLVLLTISVNYESTKNALCNIVDPCWTGWEILKSQGYRVVRVEVKEVEK